VSVGLALHLPFVGVGFVILSIFITVSSFCIFDFDGGFVLVVFSNPEDTFGLMLLEVM